MKEKIINVIMYVIFAICGFLAVVAVMAITFYMIISGLPALFKIGFSDMFFNTVWKPTASEPSFGILNMIITSVFGSALSIAIGVPIGLLTAVFLTEISSKRISNIIKSAIEILAGIPSIIYGLLGVLIVNPIMYKLELAIFKNSGEHQFTGGANFLSAVIVLAIMILPTVINISESSLRTVSPHIKSASLALGATKMQTIFQIIIPAAKSGIITAAVLGIGRAIGEAMAIILVSGNSVNVPLPFNSVRFLTTGIVSEMSYSSGLHRQALFTVGLVLFAFIMIINVTISSFLKKGDKSNG